MLDFLMVLEAKVFGAEQSEFGNDKMRDVAAIDVWIGGRIGEVV